MTECEGETIGGCGTEDADRGDSKEWKAHELRALMVEARRRRRSGVLR